jgi:hypothetical protein
MSTGHFFPLKGEAGVWQSSKEGNSVSAVVEKNAYFTSNPAGRAAKKPPLAKGRWQISDLTERSVKFVGVAM